MITINFNKLHLKPGCRILDIGCGSGRHTGAVAKYKDVLVIGADINFDEVVETKKRLIYQQQLEGKNGLWGAFVADISLLPFPNHFFDLVICSEILEHIADHHAAIVEINRVLKPGRHLVVSVPRYFPERICWAFSENYHTATNGHIRIYKKKELVGLMESNGLKEWEFHYAHSLHTPYWWLKCLVGPTRDDSLPVNLYHRFLTWDIMKHPWISRFLDNLMNPLLGKSLVLYFRKTEERRLKNEDSRPKTEDRGLKTED
ncbi:class I SAM-dependent methyltransferase [Thermodesulfobacteriota bacterium]